MSLKKVASDMRERSEDYNVFQLDVKHLVPQTNSEEEFLLVMVNENDDDEIKEIFEEWRTEWDDTLNQVSTEPFKSIGTLYEFEAAE